MRLCRLWGRISFRAAGAAAQRKSIVLLKNSTLGDKPALPLQGRPKLYLENISEEAASPYGEVVHKLEEADLAILRLKAPYEARNNEFLEFLFHAGRLDFEQPELNRLLEIMNRVPTIVDIYLDRPAVIPEIAAAAAGLLANFGASDAAVLDVIFGRFNPQGRLPFDLPSSMESVRRQMEDLPFDLEDPLYPFGFGLNY